MGGGTNAAQPAVISFHTPARSRHTPSLLPYPSVNTLRSSPAPPTLLTEHPPTPPRCLLLSLSSPPSLPSLFASHLRSGHRGTPLPTNLAFATAGSKVAATCGISPPPRRAGGRRGGGLKKKAGTKKGGGWSQKRSSRRGLEEGLPRGGDALQARENRAGTNRLHWQRSHPIGPY